MDQEKEIPISPVMQNFKNKIARYHELKREAIEREDFLGKFFTMTLIL